MALGIPLILTNIKCHLEIFEGSSLFYEFDNINELATKIQYILTDKEFRKTQISMGLQKANDYNWESRVTKYLNIYKHIIRDKDL